MGHLTKIANDLYQGMEKGKNQEKLSAMYNGMLLTVMGVRKTE